MGDKFDDSSQGQYRHLAEVVHGLEGSCKSAILRIGNSTHFINTILEAQHNQLGRPMEAPKKGKQALRHRQLGSPISSTSRIIIKWV